MLQYIFPLKAVKKIVDADTVDLTLDVGFGIDFTHRFRMHGYDACETWRPTCEDERIAGEQTTAELKRLLDIHAGNIMVHSSKNLKAYGRYECVLYYTDQGEEKNLNLDMSEYIVENDLVKENVRLEGIKAK